MMRASAEAACSHTIVDATPQGDEGTTEQCWCCGLYFPLWQICCALWRDITYNPEGRMVYLSESYLAGTYCSACCRQRPHEWE